MSDYFFTCIFFIHLAYGNRSLCFPKNHIFIWKKYFKILLAKWCQVQIHLLLSSLKIRGVFLIFQIVLKYLGESDAPKGTRIVCTRARVCLEWVCVSVVSSCPCVEGWKGNGKRKSDHGPIILLPLCKTQDLDFLCESVFWQNNRRTK